MTSGLVGKEKERAVGIVLNRERNIYRDADCVLRYGDNGVRILLISENECVCLYYRECMELPRTVY